jgi:hypothetical protein
MFGIEPLLLSAECCPFRYVVVHISFCWKQILNNEWKEQFRHAGTDFLQSISGTPYKVL